MNNSYYSDLAKAHLFMHFHVESVGHLVILHAHKHTHTHTHTHVDTTGRNNGLMAWLTLSVSLLYRV